MQFKRNEILGRRSKVYVLFNCKERMETMAYNRALWITTNHNGKMERMVSCSTCCDCNQRCKRNASVKGSVCEKCYAERMMKQYKDLKKHMEENFRILTSRILDESELPRFNNAFVRIESFGDVANEIQAINYLRMIKANPFVHFGWWTKNCDLLKNPIAELGKPQNLQIVRSSLFLNKEVKPYYDFVDRTFTVYDKEYVQKNNIEINCGGRKCIECLRCYLPDGDRQIREIKK